MAVSSVLVGAVTLLGLLSISESTQLQNQFSQARINCEFLLLSTIWSMLKLKTNERETNRIVFVNIVCRKQHRKLGSTYDQNVSNRE